MAEPGGLRARIFTALTGRVADVSGSPSGNLLGQLLAIGGPSRRTASGIDLTRAARELGVSRRTAERWVAAERTGVGQRPSKRHAKTLAAKSRRVASTQRGRRATSSDAGLRQKTRRGARLTVTALQGPLSREYMRRRTVALDLDPADAEAMIDAWENGGEKGFMTWMGAHFDNDYVADWKMDTPEAIGVEEPYGGAWR